ncbi:hypothetical protein WICMUC_000207 [Wickerhamomyces mucosus]|uniref:Uncharacterized protein n=1 Tax=Wickerhamomyces mucosus TaxID=1378264 RepID=A0A9P8PZW5_9ASCO|nr:hypothetical protein WICMUC_000207 [Wickerhamomyces mucosus]
MITDDYIPNVSTYKTLSKLSGQSLINLLKLWQDNELTKVNNQKLLTKFLQTYYKDNSSKKIYKKRQIIDKFIEFYPKGLNLLQISQIDIKWIKETLNLLWFKSMSNKFLKIGSFNDEFIIKLSNQISKFYLNHIKLEKIDNQFLILRIQLFDLNSSSSLSSSLNFFKTQSPIFIIIPQNSKNLIHNNSNSLNIIFQSLSKILDIDFQNSISNQNYFKSLNSILKLNSIQTQNLGIWNIYNSNSIDISPFDDLSKHDTLNLNNIKNLNNLNEKFKEISWLRFKSSSVIKRPNDDQLDYYKSKIPFQFKTFQLQNKFINSININLKLKGNDIFAGIHELTDLGYLNVETLPNWLTGEDSTNEVEINEDLNINLI